MGRAMSVGIAIWFINWVFSNEGFIFGSAWLKAFVDLASLLALVPFAYFTIIATRWFFEHLLWRLRRRLLVTYFLLGVLPLLLVIALVAAVGFVTVTGSTLSLVGRQLDSYLDASRSASIALGRELVEAGFDRLPQAQLRDRLNDRVNALAAVFPGVSIRVFNQSELERSISVTYEPPQNPDRDALGFQKGWPKWALETPESHGLISVRTTTGTRKVYALHLIRLPGPSRSVLQLSYPIGEDICARLTKTTGLRISPGHAYLAQLMQTARGNAVIGDRELEAIRREAAQASTRNGYPVLMRITEWETGRADENEALSVDRSFLDADHLWARLQQFRSGQFGSIFYAVISGLAVIFLLIALVAIVSAMVLTRSITGAVHNLYRGTQRIEAGDFEHEIPIRGNDQLSGLAVSFNQMTSSVRELLRVSAEKQRLDQEMRIATEVQARLFPRAAPKSETLDLAPGACLPARSVSGDYYDFLHAGPGLLGIVVADVCGKGVSAALMMANLQANLRGQVLAYVDAYKERMKLSAVADATRTGQAEAAGEPDLRAGRVRRIIDRVNRQIVGSMMDANYVTLFYAEFDERTSVLQYTNAGHNPPLVLRSAPGTRPAVERLDRGGTVLGLFRDAEYEDAEIHLESGDLVAAFTDGVIEARNPQGQEFGEERLILLLRNCAHLGAREIERLVLQTVKEWAAGAEQEDDLTLVVFKRL
jgi:sigma-B regulation protein RsbU (phosphoserine phosphatase)